MTASPSGGPLGRPDEDQVIAAIPAPTGPATAPAAEAEAVDDALNPVAAEDPRVPAESAPVTVGTTTVVIDEGVFRTRLRRPRDIASALLCILAALVVVGVAMAAKRASLALDDDLAEARRSVPELIWGLFSLLAGLGVLLYPLAAAVSLALRRRGRQLLESFIAMTLATTALVGIAALVRDHGTDDLKLALTGQLSDNLSVPTNPLLGGVVAFAVTARLFSRPRWNVVVWLVIAANTIVNPGAASTTVAAQVVSVMIGGAVGLLVRYILGTPTTRPAGSQVAETLVTGGLPVIIMRAHGGTGSGRHYRAVTAGGEHLDVVVLDRDLEGSGLAAGIWRSIRLRGPEPTNALSLRSNLERAALMGYAAEAAGVPTPPLRLAAMVSSDSALLAYETRPGRVVAPAPTRTEETKETADETARATTTAPLAEEAANTTPATDGTLDDEPTEPDRSVTDEELDVAWAALSRLQSRFLAHQNLTTDAVRYHGPDTYLTGMESGTVAASDVLLRLDLAGLLVTQSLQAGVPRAVASARRTLGDQAVLRALPVLQRVALPAETRAALRSHKPLLGDLRNQLLEIDPEVGVEPIDLERLKPRTIITMVLGTAAAYLLLSQLAQVNIVQVFSDADWRWGAVALLLSAVTYAGAAMSLSGFVPDRLSFLRTVQAQLAASFATLVSPPTLGAVAVNARYLNRSGLPPAAAAATVGVSQVAAFGVHTALLIGTGLAAGTQADLSFNPPRAVMIGAGVVAIVLVALASIAQVRRWMTKRVRPVTEQILPRLIMVAQRPGKLLEGFGGILLLNAGYCLCLVVSVRAFSDSLTIAAISFVYLAGSVVGQAAPTPGGLGVVEAALSAGLTAAGMDSALAVSAVLLFRAVTFWLPTIPGWFCFRDLTRRGLL